MLAAILATSLLAQDMSPVKSVDCPERVVLPMLSTQHQTPMIELEIGGQKYKFVLDTGAVGGRVSHEVVERLSLQPEGIVRAGDPSGKNTREVKLYRIPEIKAGGATLHGVRMMEEDGVTPKSSPLYFDGVIGAAVFHDLLLTIDYPKHEVVLTPGGMSAEQTAKAVPYHLEHGLPAMEIQIGDVKVEGHVDTGSDGGLSIPLKFKSQLHMEGEPKVVGHARTLFNSFDIYAVKVKDPILVGGVKMPIDQIEMQDVLPFGNVGGRLLKLFRVTIDQKQSRILFEG